MPPWRRPERNFNPRSPCGERHHVLSATSDAFIFQSTLPVWGATAELQATGFAVQISIHAPRVGSDSSAPTLSPGRTYFNPRSPCGERPTGSLAIIKVNGFQSTLPVWGATGLFCLWLVGFDISIHAPRVGSDLSSSPLFYVPSEISIHAPRVGSDVRKTVFPTSSALFQSTLPVWGATRRCLPIGRSAYISIHAPRVGSDSFGAAGPSRITYFNPRSPCGERR